MKMECTQRLECTQQELFSQAERKCPDQIGFLGICGDKHPVKKGPNKIGRDPKTCNIVLNLNSVSRQHAVINVLKNNDFMLMDLDSANKTKLLGKTLMPYVPLPLKNGDMVQFGEVLGIFRLLEEEDDMPMTQALPMTQLMDIPDTPVPTRYMSKLNSATTIPESPDVSDKDDSIIIASQPKGHQYKNSHHFIKPGKTISIQPIGGNKIDNIYWNSSNKSTSLNLNDSNSSLNDSIPFVKLNEKENEANANNINEINSKEVSPKVKETESIYEANTQLPESPIPPSIYTTNTQLPASSIYTANTQLPGSSCNASPSPAPDLLPSPSIHNLDTQPPSGVNLPEVCKINDQHDMQFDLYADKDIYNADTQIIPLETNIDAKSNSSPSSRKSNENLKLDRSDDVVLFDDVDNQLDDDNLESQVILTKDIMIPFNKCVETDSEPLSQIALPKSCKRNLRIKSDSSTDCEEIDDDILPTQNIPRKETKSNDGDATDCEDEMIELKINQKPNNTAEALDLEDVATQVIDVLETPPNVNTDFEDMLTQVIETDEEIEVNSKSDAKTSDFDDLPTQVLVNEDILPKKPLNPQVISDEVEISPFKIPLKSAFKAKKKDASKSPMIKNIPNIKMKSSENNEDVKYYQNTQDVYEDLFSQSSSFPEVIKENKSLPSNSKSKIPLESNVSTLSIQEVRDIIGVDSETLSVAPLKRVTSLGSDSSDIELTPKKKQPFKFMDIDLPNSQEIKTSVSLASKSIVTESSSDSEPEQNSEDQCTPILFRKKKKPKIDAKMDLTKRFDIESLPTRIITRVRKPTSKIQTVEGKKITESILKPKFLTEQDDDVDREIITENITRLKSKNEKSKNTKDTSKVLDETKNVEKHDVNKEGRLQTKTGLDKFEEIKHKSQELPKENTVKTREHIRKNKLSSPIEEMNIDLLDAVEKSNCSNTTHKNLEITKETKIIDTEVELGASKRNNKTLPPKTKEEKSRGPIMIEPHIITVPIKEEKKKREYKRRNKEPVSKNIKKVENNDTITEEKANNTIKEEQIESKRPVRNTRARNKISDNAITDTDSKTDKKPKRPKKESNDPTPEKEVRRSKRQKPIKENDAKEAVVKSILKKTPIHEQSTVYNLSSGSNTDSPRKAKRGVDEFAPEPMPKRTRSAMRATPSRTQKTCYVLFTAFPYEEVKMKLEKLGAVVVTDIMQCSVLLTLQIRRTFKLLCAVGLGKPIVGPNWVQACADTNMIVDPWLYIIKDETAEKRFKFSLERTLNGQRSFLRGYNVSSTPTVMPQPSEMKLIVQCSGGTWQEGGPRWVCLSCAADRALWPELRKRGAILVTTEFILGGVLQQKLDVELNRITAQ